MSFSSDSAFKVSADEARQRIAAAQLAANVSKVNGLLRDIDGWHRTVQSGADTIDDVIFELGEDESDTEDMIHRLQMVAQNMDRVLRSIREHSANSPADHAGSSTRSGKDDMDESALSQLRLDQ